MVVIEPMAPADVKRIVSNIVRGEGGIAYCRHARLEAQKDDLSHVDITNVLRGGAVDPGEFENGTWRYRFRTQRMVAVVQILSLTEIRVITVWRIRS